MGKKDIFLDFSICGHQASGNTSGKVPFTIFNGPSHNGTRKHNIKMDILANTQCLAHLSLGEQS